MLDLRRGAATDSAAALAISHRRRQASATLRSRPRRKAAFSRRGASRGSLYATVGGCCCNTRGIEHGRRLPLGEQRLSRLTSAAFAEKAPSWTSLGALGPLCGLCGRRLVPVKVCLLASRLPRRCRWPRLPGALAPRRKPATASRSGCHRRTGGGNGTWRPTAALLLEYWHDPSLRAQRRLRHGAVARAAARGQSWSAWFGGSRKVHTAIARHVHRPRCQASRAEAVRLSPKWA
mmetsp:Transcript_7264/g.15731  ORF Transcript_7264/g.15731 Transcript_7264/m.15731 type:complete len:234 (+) Transcript_7264:767-1468(+)